MNSARAQLLPMVLVLLAFAFVGPHGELHAQSIVVRDIGYQTGFQDTSFGHHKKGRADIAADFDLDGYIDFYIGNPGDESFILRNVKGSEETRRFVVNQVLLVGEVAWGGVTFDYDNDTDYDLFITCGANEGIGFNFLFRNDWILNGNQTGTLRFTDVTAEAGVAGPVPEGETEPIQTASANAVVADYDQDGDDDLFVNGNIHYESLPNYPELIGRNTLWGNNGDGTFTDVTEESGLSVSLAPTRHSTFLDFDNDGDADLYENNYTARNILWRNNGDGTFTDVTTDMSAPDHDLGEPIMSFVSGACDFNNDGWEDIIAFMRGGQSAPGNHPQMAGFDCGSGPSIPWSTLRNGGGPESPPLYPAGHAIFLNNGGMEFANYASRTIINDNYVGEDGVMGSMVGDVNNDGTPDIYVGNGGPPIGTADQFFVSVFGTMEELNYEDQTALIDYPAIIPPGFPEVAYPYRTHGTTFVDIDNDGLIEIAVVNGGPAGGDSTRREPNRLFKVQPETPANFLRVRVNGDGEFISRDAIGTRVALRVSKRGSAPWMLYKTLFGGSCFSAQNSFWLHFGLADADSIELMQITWPNGSASEITSGLSVNTFVKVGVGRTGNLMVKSTPLSETFQERPSAFTLEQNYPNPFNPSTTIRYTTQTEGPVEIKVFDLLGQQVATLVEEFQPAGTWAAVWDGRNDRGYPVASGLYSYRMKVNDIVVSRRMMLTR